MENFEAPEATGSALLPGETVGAPPRSFWVQNDLSTFYPVSARSTGPQEDFTSNDEAFVNCARYQTCQVTRNSYAGRLPDPPYLPGDVSDYYLLSTNVRSINFRFFDAEAATCGTQTADA